MGVTFIRLGFGCWGRDFHPVDGGEVLMANEIVERMCRAAVARGSGDPKHWDGMTPNMQEAWRLQMEAALESLREPTEAMIAAVCPQGSAVSEYLPVVWRSGWRAMIAAALKG
jgi:hypothetical protein